MDFFAFTLELFLKLSFVLSDGFEEAGLITAEMFSDAVENFVATVFTEAFYVHILPRNKEILENTIMVLQYNKLQKLTKIIFNNNLPTEEKELFVPYISYFSTCTYNWMSANINEKKSLFAKVIFDYSNTVPKEVFVNEQEWEKARDNTHTKFQLCQDEAAKAKADFITSIEALEMAYAKFYTANSDKIPDFPATLN
jgi:hypothetical protein